MTDAQPVDKKRSRRIYIYWGVALTLLLVLGLFSWLVVVPVTEVRYLLTSWIQQPGRFSDDDDFLPTEVAKLGGPDSARRKLRLYLKMPKSIAPDRSLAIPLLATCGKDAEPDLLEYLRDDDDESVRAGAAMCLCDSSNPKDAKIIAALIRALEDSSVEVRLCAAVALGHIGPTAPDAVPSLKKLLHDNDENVRQAAAEALNKIRGAKKEQ